MTQTTLSDDGLSLYIPAPLPRKYEAAVTIPSGTTATVKLRRKPSGGSPSYIKDPDDNSSDYSTTETSSVGFYGNAEVQMEISSFSGDGPITLQLNEIGE